MSNKIQFSPDKIDDIITEYVTNKKSIRNIALKYHHDDSVISRVLKENGVNIRSLSEAHSFEYDKTYFNQINASDKAYWLGFIYADGFISTKSNDKFCIKLNVKDIDVLNQLKEDLKSKHNIHIYQNKVGYKHNDGSLCEYCELAIGSTDLVNQLKALGVNERKTKQCDFPSYDIVPNQFIWDFIRGFFDGDGSVYITKNYRNNVKYAIPGVSFLGTEPMMNGIRNEFYKHYQFENNIYSEKGIKDLYGFKLGGSNQVNTFYHLLYPEGCTRYLSRKKDVFDKFLVNDIIRTLKYIQIDGEEYRWFPITSSNNRYRQRVCVADFDAVEEAVKDLV